MIMDIHCARNNETVVRREVKDLGAGAGQITCLECGGSGDWDFMEPEIPTEKCVPCKGSGKMLVSI